MNGKGKVAILAGNQNAPNLQQRVQGAKDEAAKYPGITIVGTFNHIETPQDAAAEVVRVNNAYPDIQGWAMIGGWPLFTQSLLTDLNPARIKVASVDALPEQLAYVEKGVVPVLLAQSVYLWGDVGVAHDRRQAALQEGRAGRSSRWSSCACRRRTSERGRGSSRRGASPTCRPRTSSSSSSERRVSETGGRSLREHHEALSRRAGAGRRLARDRRAARVTRSAARMAPGRARSGRFSPASTRPTADDCSSTDARCASPDRATRLPPASAWCTRSSRSATTCRSPRTCVSRRFRRERGFVERDEHGARARARCSPRSASSSTCCGRWAS